MVTDRVILDRQIRVTTRQYAQVWATVGHAEGSDDLRRLVEGSDHGIRLKYVDKTLAGIRADQ